MKIIKTSQYGGYGSHLVGDDVHELDDLMKPNHEDHISLHDDGLGEEDQHIDELGQIGHDSVDGDAASSDDSDNQHHLDGVDDGFDPSDAHLNNLMGELGEGDVGLSVHLDTPNEIGNDLPVDIQIDPEAFHGESDGMFMDDHDQDDGFGNESPDHIDELFVDGHDQDNSLDDLDIGGELGGEHHDGLQFDELSDEDIDGHPHTHTL